MEFSVCVTDDDYEAWRAIRIAFVPDERCDTVRESAQDSSDRLLLLAVMDGTVFGSCMANESESAGGGFAAPECGANTGVEASGGTPARAGRAMDRSRAAHAPSQRR